MAEQMRRKVRRRMKLELACHRPAWLRYDGEGRGYLQNGVSLPFVDCR